MTDTVSPAWAHLDPTRETDRRALATHFRETGVRDVFSHADGSDSGAFFHYIGGLQTYAPDLMMVYAPTVNSYRRYAAGSQAPTNVQWGYDNRTAGLQENIAPTEAVVGNGYAHARGLPRTFDAAHAQMAGSAHAPRLLGERFVRGFLAVKALEHDHYLNEISAWERRYLLPQV